MQTYNGSRINYGELDTCAITLNELINFDKIVMPRVDTKNKNSVASCPARSLGKADSSMCLSGAQLHFLGGSQLSF